MRKIDARERGELECRAFLGDDVWRRWKTDYDDCMAYRKTLKGKPTEEQRVQIEVNSAFIEFYGSVLFHSPTLAMLIPNKCVCTRCGQKRSSNVHVVNHN